MLKIEIFGKEVQEDLPITPRERRVGTFDQFHILLLAHRAALLSHELLFPLA